MEDTMKQDKEKMNNDGKKIEEGKSLQENIDGDIRHCENSIKAADNIIADANVTLQKALSVKKLDRNEVQNAQSKIEIGIDRKRKGPIENAGYPNGLPNCGTYLGTPRKQIYQDY